MKRSNDAHQAEGARAEDTVLPKSDHQNLTPMYQQPFTELGIFMVAPYSKLKQTASSNLSSLGKSDVFQVPNVVTAVPAARPFYHED